MVAILSAHLSHWTPELAWWYGAFLGDGHASGSHPTITFTGNHLTVERWRQLIAPLSVRHEIPHSPATSVVKLWSRELSGWLAARGISGPKTFSLEWPSDLPDPLLPHFVRGLWDSDGCLSILDRAALGLRGNPQPQAIYVSVTHSFVERLADEVARVTGLPRQRVSVDPRKPPSAPISRLQYVGANAHPFTDWLYSESSSHMRNEDRMAVYSRFLELRAKRCACGEPIYSKDKCRACWNASIPNTTGPGTECSTKDCGRVVLARGRCSACLKRERRAALKAASAT